MSAIGFYFYNITFQRKGGGKWVFAQGEIENNTRKDYHTALFHFSVFDKHILLWTGVIKMAGLRRQQTKPFELFMEGLDHYAVSAISRYEIYFESGY